MTRFILDQEEADFTFGAALAALDDDGERFNENHDPSNGQFSDGGGSSGGSSSGGSATKPASAGNVNKPKPEAAHATSYEFVSPSVASHLAFHEAVDAISSGQQQSLHDASVYINGALDINAREYDIVGAWTDGAENSVLDVVDNADWDKLKLAASMKGYLADQKQVLIFHEAEGGEAAMAHFEASGELADIHKNLLQDGLAFHTLVPHDGGATVYVADLDGSAANAIEKAATRYDAEVGIKWGRAEFLGTQKQDGSDREQRDDARNLYAENIRQSKVDGHDEVWARVRDRWGQSLNQEVENSGSRAAVSLSSPAHSRAMAWFFERYNENHDPDNGQFASGGGGSSSSSSSSGGSDKGKGTGVGGSGKGNTKPGSSGSKTAPAAKAAADSAAAGVKSGDRKAKLGDFEKAKIRIDRSTLADKERVDRFIDTWDSQVGESPETFKKAFTGGVDTTMNVSADRNGRWELSGEVLDDKGKGIGTYTRVINFRNKTAESAFFQINRDERDNGVGKQMLAGNVEMYQKMGLDSVKVHANIDVGGYAWARYGYVPTRESWRELSAHIRNQLNRGGTSNNRANGGFDTYTPGSWEELSDDEQETVKDAWTRSTRSEMIDSEVDYWRESGGALDEAKYALALDYNNDSSGAEWAHDTIKEYLDEHAENGKPVPFTADQVGKALSVDYNTDGEGRGDPDISFDDKELQEPTNLNPDQMDLPGIDKIAPEDHLTSDMRTELTERLTKAFNDKAENDQGDIEPPEYLANDIGERQDEYWDSMSERDRYNWARDNGALPEHELERDDDDVDPDDVEKDENSDDTLMRLASSNNPKALWAIADSPRGKELLLNSDWHGEINFKDKETMDRFNAYVGRKKAA